MTAAVASFLILALYVLLALGVQHIMAQLSDVLASVAAVDAAVDALSARVAALPVAADLQPAVDALAAVKTKLDAIAPAPVA